MGAGASIQQDHAESAYNLALAHRIAREELDAENGMLQLGRAMRRASRNLSGSMILFLFWVFAQAL